MPILEIIAAPFKAIKSLSPEHSFSGYLIAALIFTALITLAYFGQNSILGILPIFLVFLLLASILTHEIFFNSKKINKNAKQGVKEIHDTFLAAPMDSIHDFVDDGNTRLQLVDIQHALKDHTEANLIYCGSRLIKSVENFDEPQDGYKKSFRALESAKNFVLIWPDKVPSSVLFELGVAAAKKIPTVIFYRKQEDLPYLLLGKMNAGTRRAGWPVRFRTYEELSSITDIIKQKGNELFEFDED